jgi:hypothetical protein
VRNPSSGVQPDAAVAFVHAPDIELWRSSEVLLTRIATAFSVQEFTRAPQQRDKYRFITGRKSAVFVNEDSRDEHKG